MPVTASNGFPCLEKNLGEHKQILFFAANIFNTRKNMNSWRALLPHFWELPLICGKHWFKFWIWFDLGCSKIWIFTFGFHVVRWDPWMNTEVLGQKKRFLCNMSTDVVNKLSNSARNTGFPSTLTHVSLSSLLSWLPVLVLMDSWWQRICGA